MMRLSDKQDHFSTDLALFILWCKSRGYKITRGEAWRTDYQQEEYYKTGFSRVKHSKHQDRLAQDLNFFFDNVSMWQIDEKLLKITMQRIGDKWESMRLGNRWGGNFINSDGSHFYDFGHFEAG